MFLAHDHLIHTMHQVSDEGALLLNANIQFADVYSFCHNYFKNLNLSIFKQMQKYYIPMR